MSEETLIVIAAEDACGFDGEVSAHFGRCPFFLLAEADGTTPISTSAPPVVRTGKTIRIAAFNIQVFGRSNARKRQVLTKCCF